MRTLLLIPALLLFLAQSARATWSIVVCDTATGEVIVASATCIANYDLQSALPVVRIGLGGAAAQSAIDVGGNNRLIIWNQMEAGTTPAQILAVLANNDFNHQSRQYGIVTFNDPPAKFTGNKAGPAKQAVAGTLGTLRYSIQGNVLTDKSVIFTAEQVLRNSPGDLGQRVLAAMEAARALGGDGRCSCAPSAPTSCGAPPPAPFKSAHIGFFVIARPGDIEGNCNGQVGCANGNYYLNFNIIGNAAAVDPVIQMQAAYTTWRAGLSGRPDHVLSEVASDAARLPADGLTTTDVTVRLVDVDGVPLSTGGATLSLAPLTPASGSLVTASPITDNGDGTYTFALTAGTTIGTAELLITADDGISPVQLYPPLKLELDPPTALHASDLQVAASAPVDVDFTIDLGASAAGQIYILLGSLAGTQPGIALPGALFPLNSDTLLNWTLLNAGPPLLPGSFGVLDANGRAHASLTVPANVLIPFVGLHSDWAALTALQPYAVTNPVGLDVTL